MFYDSSDDLEPPAILDPRFVLFCFVFMYSFLLKTHRNQGNRDRKIDLCINGCIWSKNIH